MKIYKLATGNIKSMATVVANKKAAIKAATAHAARKRFAQVAPVIFVETAGGARYGVVPSRYENNVAEQDRDIRIKPRYSEEWFAWRAN